MMGGWRAFPPFPIISFCKQYLHFCFHFVISFLHENRANGRRPSFVHAVLCHRHRKPHTDFLKVSISPCEGKLKFMPDFLFFSAPETLGFCCRKRDFLQQKLKIPRAEIFRRCSSDIFFVKNRHFFALCAAQASFQNMSFCNRKPCINFLFDISCTKRQHQTWVPQKGVLRWHGILGTRGKRQGGGASGQACTVKFCKK